MLARRWRLGRWLVCFVAEGDDCPALFVGVDLDGDDWEAVGHLEGDSAEVVGGEMA